MEEGDIASFFVQPATGASGENVSPPTTEFQKMNNDEGLS